MQASVFFFWWLVNGLWSVLVSDTAYYSLCIWESRTWLRVWDSFSALAGGVGGSVPAAAAPRHRHHSPRNEPRVRWEGWAARVGKSRSALREKPCSDTSCLHGHVWAPDFLRLLRWADEVSSLMEFHSLNFYRHRIWLYLFIYLILYTCHV